jgi:hypothetical protein
MHVFVYYNLYFLKVSDMSETKKEPDQRSLDDFYTGVRVQRRLPFDRNAMTTSRPLVIDLYTLESQHLLRS